MTPPSGGGAPAPAPARPPVESILKWIGAAAAILSLIAGGFQVTRLLSDVSERKRFINESMEVARQQGSSGNMTAAWLTLEGALKSADEGGQFAKITGQLSEERRQLRLAEEELAMKWLRNAHAPEGRSFSDVVDRLLPALERGAAAATGTAKADRLAHIGWGYFLKSRDGVTGLNPAGRYQAALEADPADAWAHVFWGHWILWTGGAFEEALTHFAAAAKPAATRTEVRAIQLAALRNRRDARSTAEWLRVVDEMRRGGEPLGKSVFDDTYQNYRFAVIDGAVPPEYLAALPAPAQMELLGAACAGLDPEGERPRICKAAQALLREVAGDRKQALEEWRAVRASTSPAEITLRSRADAAIRRLQAAPPAK